MPHQRYTSTYVTGTEKVEKKRETWQLLWAAQNKILTPPTKVKLTSGLCCTVVCRYSFTLNSDGDKQSCQLMIPSKNAHRKKPHQVELCPPLRALLTFVWKITLQKEAGGNRALNSM